MRHAVQVKSNFVQDGVSMYFGSADPLNREHLRSRQDWSKAPCPRVTARASFRSVSASGRL